MAGTAVFLYILSILPTSVLDTSDIARAVRKLARTREGVASIAELRAELGLSERTLHRGLSRLVAAGTLFRVSRDRYSDSPCADAPTGEAKKIVRAIERLDADAHLSGYDVLAGFAHQFVYEYPHLVYCHPPHADGVAGALASSGFVVLAAGPGALRGPAMPRTVLLRRQPLIASRTLVHGAVATPEKAWVDLLRETPPKRRAIRLRRAWAPAASDERPADQHASAPELRAARRVRRLAARSHRRATPQRTGTNPARGWLRRVSIGRSALPTAPDKRDAAAIRLPSAPT